MARSEKKDFYQILEVSKDATEEEIKSVYRKLAIKYHPDKTKGDKIAEDKFKQVTEAYETLSDPMKRKSYDGFSSFSNIFDSSSNTNSNIFSSFSSMFTQTRNSFIRGGRGQDIKITIEITLEDVYSGTKKIIKYKKNDKCSECNGFGTLHISDRTICTKCNGSGKIISSTSYGSNVIFNSSTICDKCNGQGSTINFDCKSCAGTGRILNENSISLNIDSGIMDGHILLFRGAGHQGQHNGVPGDLIVAIKVRSHTNFLRAGNDLIKFVDLRLTDAVLGTKMNILTFNGSREITIIAGTNINDKISIEGCGLPDFQDKSKKGNLIIKFKINLPQSLTQTQQTIFEQLKKEGL